MKNFNYKVILKNKLFRFSLKWITFWLGCLGIYSLAIHSNYTVNNITGTTLSLLYYTVSIIASIAIFRGHKFYEPSKSNVEQLKWIFVSFIVFVLVSPVVNYTIPLSDSLKQYLLEIDLHYPLFYYSSSFIKVADIIFQQILIYSYLMRVVGLAGDKLSAIAVFTLCFFVLHLPLLVPFQLMGFLFIIPSLFAGVIFSYLILYHKKMGLLLSILVHEMFYLFLGSILRYMY